MALTAIPSAPLAKNLEKQQKIGTASDQTKTNRQDPSTRENKVEKSINDNVLLSQAAVVQSSEKNEGSVAPIKSPDGESAMELLQETMQAILSNQKTALSAQSIKNPEVTLNLLSEQSA